MSDAHQSLRTVELPRRMLGCARDPRGYPIPFLMIPDSQITMDPIKFQVCVLKKLCMICGKRLDNKKWFIGGIATAQNRLFTDPAMHEECARYALKVCPFLSNNDMKYRKKTMEQVEVNPHIRKGRSPTQILLQTTGFKVIGWRGKVYALANRWRYVEHWRDGEKVETPPDYSAEELAEHIGVFDLGGMYYDEIVE